MEISDRIFLFGTLFPDKVRKFWPSRGRFPLTSKRNPQCVHTASLCTVVTPGQGKQRPTPRIWKEMLQEGHQSPLPLLIIVSGVVVILSSIVSIISTTVMHRPQWTLVYVTAWRRRNQNEHISYDNLHIYLCYPVHLIWFHPVHFIHTLYTIENIEMCPPLSRPTASTRCPQSWRSCLRSWSCPHSWSCPRAAAAAAAPPPGPDPCCWRPGCGAAAAPSDSRTGWSTRSRGRIK